MTSTCLWLLLDKFLRELAMYGASRRRARMSAGSAVFVIRDSVLSV